MGRQDPADYATEQYDHALTALRAARQAYVAARVPMDLLDGRPPALSSGQHAAVWAYARAWDRYARAMQACAETGAARR